MGPRHSRVERRHTMCQRYAKGTTASLVDRFAPRDQETENSPPRLAGLRCESCQRSLIELVRQTELLEHARGEVMTSVIIPLQRTPAWRSDLRLS